MALHRVTSQIKLGPKRTWLPPSAGMAVLGVALLCASVAITRGALEAHRRWLSAAPCTVPSDLLQRLEQSLAGVMSASKLSTRRILTEKAAMDASALIVDERCSCGVQWRDENLRLESENAELRDVVSKLKGTKKKADAEKHQAVGDKQKLQEEVRSLRKQLAEEKQAAAALEASQKELQGKAEQMVNMSAWMKLELGKSEKSVEEILSLMQQKLQEKDKEVEDTRTQATKQVEEKVNAMELLADENAQLSKEKKQAEDLLSKTGIEASPTQAQDMCLKELKLAQTKLTAAESQVETCKASRLKVQSQLDSIKQHSKYMEEATSPLKAESQTALRFAQHKAVEGSTAAPHIDHPEASTGSPAGATSSSSSQVDTTMQGRSHTVSSMKAQSHPKDEAPVTSAGKTSQPTVAAQ